MPRVKDGLFQIPFTKIKIAILKNSYDKFFKELKIRSKIELESFEFVNNFMNLHYFKNISLLYIIVLIKKHELDVTSFSLLRNLRVRKNEY